MKALLCRVLGHDWRNRVAGGSLCRRCRLWQDKRATS